MLVCCKFRICCEICNFKAWKYPWVVVFRFIWNPWLSCVWKTQVTDINPKQAITVYLTDRYISWVFCLFADYHSPLQQSAASLIYTRASPCLTVSPKLIRRSTNCHCPPKKYKLQFRLFLPSSALHLLLVVALQGAVTWHYDHFFPFNLPKTKQRENLNLVLKDCHTNGQKFRFPKIAGKHDSCQTFSSKLYQAGLSF